MIDTKCPHCFVESEADDYLLGQSVRCPQCRKVFILHAHSTELLLDSIIPGVPQHKPEDEKAAQKEDDEAPARMTLKMKPIRKPILPRHTPVSPLLDPEPPVLPAESMIRQVEVVAVSISFWTVFRLTFMVMASILILSVIGGLIALAFIGMVAASNN
jgi:hypothetical protein